MTDPEQAPDTATAGWQRYTDPLARERMAAGGCPECGERPEKHTGRGLGRCSLTDSGAAGRISQYQEDERAEGSTT